MTIVRGVPVGEGWLARNKIVSRFDPKTPAKTLLAMMAATHPKKVRDIRDLPSAIEDWESKVKILKEEQPGFFVKAQANGGGERHSGEQHDDEENPEDDDNSINYVGGKSGGKHGKGGKGFGKSKGKGFQGYCYTCGELGHAARECPKGKGKGKVQGW